MTPHAVFVAVQLLVLLQKISHAAIVPTPDSFLASASSESGHHAAASSTVSTAVQQSPAPQAPTEAEQIARATEILREHGETVERVIFEALAVPSEGEDRNRIVAAGERLAYSMAGPIVGFFLT